MSTSIHSAKEFRTLVLRYIYGGLIALTLTTTAFLLVASKALEQTNVVVAILALAIVQAVAQLYLFLHIGDEKKPWWKNISLIYIFAMTVVLVVGSIWVIMNMNYNMGMSPEQMEQYMLQQNKKGF